MSRFLVLLCGQESVDLIGQALVLLPQAAEVVIQELIDSLRRRRLDRHLQWQMDGLWWLMALALASVLDFWGFQSGKKAHRRACLGQPGDN